MRCLAVISFALAFSSSIAEPIDRQSRYTELLKPCERYCIEGSQTDTRCTDTKSRFECACRDPTLSPKGSAQWKHLTDCRESECVGAEEEQPPSIWDIMFGTDGLCLDLMLGFATTSASTTLVPVTRNVRRRQDAGISKVGASSAISPVFHILARQVASSTAIPASPSPATSVASLAESSTPSEPIASPGPATPSEIASSSTETGEAFDFEKILVQHPALPKILSITGIVIFCLGLFFLVIGAVSLCTRVRRR